MISLIAFCIILFIYFSLPAIAPPIVAPSAALCPDTTGPASDPIAPPTTEPTREPMLLLFEPVPLHPDAISVNTQEQSYIRYNILTGMNMKVMVL